VFIQFYGQAEAAATITCLPKSEHRVDTEDHLRRLSSAGRETFATRVRILDPDGNELPAGEVGEISVRGDLVMTGYWNRPEATAEAIRDGWLRTGDAGYLDSDGYLFITDRIKDMIISGGSNIYAREVEDTLLQHAAIAQVAVIGIPDPKWGEVVAAVIVPAAGASITEEDVIAFARDSMASYKKPHHVWFVDALPTSAYGKVLKRELRKQFPPPPDLNGGCRPDPPTTVAAAARQGSTGRARVSLGPPDGDHRPGLIAAHTGAPGHRCAELIGGSSATDDDARLISVGVSRDEAASVPLSMATSCWAAVLPMSLRSVLTLLNGVSRYAACGMSL
jgi:hypothetical protein